MRADGRKTNELRKVTIETHYLRGPAGSVLYKSGNTWVLCAASIEEKVPPFLKPQDGSKPESGWVTAEYAMMPGSTETRSGRGPNGRSKEIERLIGRALRAAVDTKALGPRTVTIDCDVIQADGGTRTAAITGGFVALALAVLHLRQKGIIAQDPIIRQVAAVSVGLVDGQVLLDLPYEEDSKAEVDMNIIMAEASGRRSFVEVQGTGEHGTFDRRQMDALCDLAEGGIMQLCELQRAALR